LYLGGNIKTFLIEFENTTDCRDNECYKVKAHNEAYPSKKVTTATAKAVVRRGMGAYSKSHRPTITGGAPNSRQAWGLARLNKFLLKKRGVKVKSAYIQDDDLL